jgi:SAM-dependent methyltransferase
MTSWAKYSDKARDWSERQYADAGAYLRHRAELVRTLGPPLDPGDSVLDLACGDGALGDFLPQHRYVGVDASEAMVDAGRMRGREIVLGDLNEYEPDAPVTATTIFRAIYYANDRRGALRAHPCLHGEEARLRPQPTPVQARRRPWRSRGCRLHGARDAALLCAADPERSVPDEARAKRAACRPAAPLPVHGAVRGFFVKKR